MARLVYKGVYIGKIKKGAQTVIRLQSSSPLPLFLFTTQLCFIFTPHPNLQNAKLKKQNTKEAKGKILNEAKSKCFSKTEVD